MQLNLIYTLVKDATEAKKLSLKLLEEKLIACANIYQPIQSVYVWEGKLEEATEVPLILKTTREAAPFAEKRLKELHSYQTPCIVHFAGDSALPDYLRWVYSSVKVIN